MKVGKQIAECLIKHQKLNKQEAILKSIEMLKMVGIPNAEKRSVQYPHEFSGGMRQRVVIAIALACNPKLLIADEPTTALDVTIQAQILELMKDLKDELNTSIILITHDLGVVAEMADNIIIMYAGKVVESGTYLDIFYNPCHPYTWGLLGSIPRVDATCKEDLMSIKGTPPDLLAEIKGCAFKDRCKYAMQICYEEYPENIKIDDNHVASCWLQHEYSPNIINPIINKGAKADA
jgi:oligopeptide transport system ATP-binding protein